MIYNVQQNKIKILRITFGLNYYKSLLLNILIIFYMSIFINTDYKTISKILLYKYQPIFKILSILRLVYINM